MYICLYVCIAWGMWLKSCSSSSCSIFCVLNVWCRMSSSHFSMHHLFSTAVIQIFIHYHFCWAIVCTAWPTFQRTQTPHTDNEKCLFGLKSVAIVCHSKTLSCEKHRLRVRFITLVSRFGRMYLQGLNDLRFSLLFEKLLYKL